MAGHEAQQKGSDMMFVSPENAAPLRQSTAQCTSSWKPAYSKVPGLRSDQELVQTRAVKTLCRHKHTLPSWKTIWWDAKCLWAGIACFSRDKVNSDPLSFIFSSFISGIVPLFSKSVAVAPYGECRCTGKIECNKRFNRTDQCSDKPLNGYPDGQRYLFKANFAVSTASYFEAPREQSWQQVKRRP